MLKVGVATGVKLLGSSNPIGGDQVTGVLAGLTIASKETEPPRQMLVGLVAFAMISGPTTRTNTESISSQVPTNPFTVSQRLWVGEVTRRHWQLTGESPPYKQ